MALNLQEKVNSPWIRMTRSYVSGEDPIYQHTQLPRRTILFNGGCLSADCNFNLLLGVRRYFAALFYTWSGSIYTYLNLHVVCQKSRSPENIYHIRSWLHVHHKRFPPCILNRGARHQIRHPDTSVACMCIEWCTYIQTCRKLDTCIWVVQWCLILSHFIHIRALCIPF